MDLIRIKYGETDITESLVFEGGSPETKIPIILSYFLIKTQDKVILVDVGSDFMVGFELMNFTKPVDMLRKFGYAPDDITHIIITHTHHDHVGAVRYYENAEIYIQKDEYTNGKKHVPEGFKINFFEKDFDFDENIKVKVIGGHSIGSCVVEINDNGYTTVLCGDECYTYYNIENKIPTASCYSKEKSAMFIEKYATNDYKCLLCHDIKKL